MRVRGDHAGALQAMTDGSASGQLGLRGSFGHFMFVNGADDLLRLGRWDEAAGASPGGGRHDGALAHRRRAAAGKRPGSSRRPGDLLSARAELDAATDASCRRSSLPRSPRPAQRSRWPKGTAVAAEHVAGAVGGVEDPFYTSPLYSLGLRIEAERAESARAHRARSSRTAHGALLDALEALVEGAASPDARAHRALARAERRGSRAARRPSAG